MAFVCQQRMWAESDRLEKAGMPPTDAREQAEREHLMLEPEEEAEDFSDLPPELQGQGKERMRRSRAELQRLGLL
jgi:hypothetical protein